MKEEQLKYAYSGFGQTFRVICIYYRRRPGLSEQHWFYEGTNTAHSLISTTGYIICNDPILINKMVGPLKYEQIW